MVFQPFSITCVTCGSRLRVGRPELVGNIVGCPKCQSMVQLTPPGPGNEAEPAVAVGNAVVDSNALTEDSISRDELAEGPAIPDPASLDGEQAGFAEPPPVFRTDSTIAPESTSRDAAGDEPEAALGAPPPDWQSHSTAKSRKIAMLVIVVLGSIVSASILFGVLLRDGSGDVAMQDTADANQTSESDQPGEADPLIREDDSDANDQETGDESTNDDAVDGGDSVEVGPNSQNLNAQNPNVSDGSPDQPATADGPGPGALGPEDGSRSEVDTAADPAASMDPSLTESSPSALPQDLLPTNPLLPSNPLQGMTPTGPVPPDNGSEPSDDAATLTELPKDLQNMLNGLGGMERPQFSNTQPAPETIDEFQLDRAADADVNLEAAVDQPSPINMRQTLGLPVAMQAADPAGYPLNDLMLVISELSGVPIEVEWVSLDFVGMPINTRVALPKSWLTLEELLTAVCEANDLTFDQNPRSLTIRPTDERFDQAVRDYLDLNDIQDDRESAVATARALLGQSDGDESAVNVPTKSGPQQLAVLVCETIRRARGTQGKMSDAAYARWAGDFKSQVAAWPELVDGVSGPPRLQASSFVTLVRQISKANGATCFINWQDGARQDLSPSADVILKTGEGVSASAALEDLLEPQRMHVRVVDAGHWWVGSQASFDRFPVVVSFGSVEDAAKVADQVGEILRGASSQEQILGAVVVDPGSQKCLAIVPRYLLRQLPRLLELGP